MGTYRVAHRLTTPAGVAETFVGAQVAADRSERHVLARRLASSLASDASVLERLGGLTAAWRGARVSGLSAFIEVGRAGDDVWVVEELVEGETLRGLLTALTRHGGRVRANEGVALIAHLAATLRALHALPLCHGEVSGSTVMVTAVGEVKLMSLGLATAAGAAPTLGPVRTELSSLAPEQLNGPGDAATDVFHLGLLLHELSLGRPLFTAADAPAALEAAHRYVAVERSALSGVPLPFASLLTHLLTRDPAARPPMSVVVDRLDAAAKSFGWTLSTSDIAVLFARAFPIRRTLTSYLSTPGTPLLLEPLGLSTDAPVALGRIATRRVSRSDLQPVTDSVVESIRPGVKGPEATSRPSSFLTQRDLHFAEHLLSKRRLDAAQVDTAFVAAREHLTSLGDALVTLGLLDAEAVAAELSELTHSPYLSAKRLEEMRPTEDALRILPRERAETLCVMPLSLKSGSQLMVAMRDPMDQSVVEQLKGITGARSVIGTRATEAAIREAIRRSYSTESSATPLSGPALVRSDDAWLRLLFAPLDSQPTGRVARRVLALVVGLGTRLGLIAPELSRLRFAAAAVVIANVVDARGCGAPPRPEALQVVAGVDWPRVAPLVVPLFRGSLGPIVANSLAALCAPFLLARLEETLSTRDALDSLKREGRLLGAVTDALEAELGDELSSSS